MTDDALDRWTAARRAQADAFARETFGLRGTLRLHRAALGWDLLRAPLNILLAALYLVQRLAALLLSALRLRRAAHWLRDHPLQLRTAVQARVEQALLTRFLDTPGPDTASALLSAPALRPVFRARASVAEARAMADEAARAIADYAGTRAAVADMTTALVTLALGAALFHALTPGMISVAPAVAEAIAHQTAIDGFPLGATLGGVWYGWFPPDTPLALAVGALAALLMVASLVSAFAGLVADPVQTALGIHRRRLLRLVDALEETLSAPAPNGFVAREHYLARVFDLGDAALSLTRLWRG